MYIQFIFSAYFLPASNYTDFHSFLDFPLQCSRAQSTLLQTKSHDCRCLGWKLSSCSELLCTVCICLHYKTDVWLAMFARVSCHDALIRDNNFNCMPLHVCEHLQQSPADFSSREQQVALPSIHCVFPRDTANTASSAISKSHFALTQLHTRITQTVMLCADAISRSDSSLVCWLGSWTFVNTSVCWLLLSRSVRSGFYQGTHCSPAGPEPDDFTM